MATTMAVALVVTFGFAVPFADASRAPTRAERTAIKRVAIKTCEAAAPDECRLVKARVSTRNSRYAWADVVGEGFSGVLLKRASRHTRRFRVIGTQGGGIGACDYWRDRAPRAVLHDLRIHGITDDSGTTRICG